MMLEEPVLTPAALAVIARPTLVLAGDRDFVTVQHTAAIPAARLCIVPGGSHGLLTEQPAFTTQVIREFLAG